MNQTQHLLPSRPSPANVERDFRYLVIQRTSLALGLLTILGTLTRHLVAPTKMQNFVVAIGLGVVMLLISYWSRVRSYQSIFGFVIIGIVCLVSINAGVNNGGVRAPAMSLLVLSPLFGFLCVGRKGALFGVAFSIFGLMGLALFDPYVKPLESPERYHFYKAAVMSFCILASYALGSIYERTRKHAENEIYHLSAKVVQSAKMASLGEMSSGLSHEINNPMTVVKGRIQMIVKLLESQDFDRETLINHIHKIDQSLDRISKVVKGLRVFSGKDAAEAPKPHLIGTVIESALDFCSEQFNSRGVRLEVAPPPRATVLCRPSEIMQIILNLLANGLYVAEHTENPENRWVKLEVLDKQNRIEIVVTDCGQGIEPSISKRMMEPFFTTKEPGKGTGLGLSISRGIAESHGGNLAYDSISKNTRFVLTLPKA